MIKENMAADWYFSLMINAWMPPHVWILWKNPNQQSMGLRFLVKNFPTVSEVWKSSNQHSKCDRERRVGLANGWNRLMLIIVLIEMIMWLVEEFLAIYVNIINFRFNGGDCKIRRKNGIENNQNYWENAIM